MLSRNKQSHEVQNRSSIRMSKKNILEDSSESTDYKDSSLIKSFHTQLAFQDNNKKTISYKDLNQEQTKPYLDLYKDIKRQIDQIHETNNELKK
jgi:hypothetical protein